MKTIGTRRAIYLGWGISARSAGRVRRGTKGRGRRMTDAWWDSSSGVCHGPAWDAESYFRGKRNWHQKLKRQAKTGWLAIWEECGSIKSLRDTQSSLRRKSSFETSSDLIFLAAFQLFRDVALQNGQIFFRVQEGCSCRVLTRAFLFLRSNSVLKNLEMYHQASGAF